MYKDPVCGMEIQIRASAATSQYHDTMYYFCSERCKDVFDQDPEKYIGKHAHAEKARRSP